MSCVFLDYRYLWRVHIFGRPDVWAFRYPSVLLQCSSQNDPTRRRSSDHNDGRPRDDDYSSEYDRSSDHDRPLSD